MPRTVKEWIGATPDSRIPPRVRVRVFEKFGGVCQLSKRKIRAGDPWDCDHIIALINGGEHRESNLQPALAAPHREKTADDVGEKSKVANMRKKHLGIKTSNSRPIPGSKRSGWKKLMNGKVVRR